MATIQTPRPGPADRVEVPGRRFSWRRLFRPTFRATPPTAAARLRAPSWFYSFLLNKLGSGASVSLPALYITEILGGTVADVGIAGSVTNGATVPAAAFWGWLSDRYGTRKLYLMLGFLGFGLPTLLMGFSQDVAHYVLLSFLVGALSVAGTPVASTLIMDTVPKEDWDEAFGSFNQVSGWGMVLGRVIGLLLIAYGIAWLGNELTQRSLWILSGLLSLLAVFWAWRAVPEPHMAKPRQPRPDAALFALQSGFPLIERVRFLPSSFYPLPRWNPFAAMATLCSGTWAGIGRLPGSVGRGTRQGIARLDDPLVAYYVVSFVLFTMIVMAYTPFPVWQRQELQNSSAWVFLVGMLNSIGAAFSYRWVGSLTKRWGSLRVQMLTISLRIGVFGGFAVMAVLGIYGLPSLLPLIVLQVISGLGWAGIAVAGNSTVAHLAPAGHEGAAMGAYTSCISVGSIIGALISGYLVLWLGYAALFALGAAGTGLCVIGLAVIRLRARPEVRLRL